MSPTGRFVTWDDHLGDRGITHDIGILKKEKRWGSGEMFFVAVLTFETPDLYFFNPPATDVELNRIEAEFDAKLPPDLREMLLEFNGIDKMEGGVEPRSFLELTT